MSEDDNHETRRRDAFAVLYADVRGFSSLLDALEGEPDSEEVMNAYLASWSKLRDALVRDPEHHSSRFYLAHRSGDAFVLLAFEKSPAKWIAYVREFLLPHFHTFTSSLKGIAGMPRAKLRLVLYSTPTKRVPYFETSVMRDTVAGKLTIARRDFLCTAFHRCARIAALPEAEHALLLANEGAYHVLTSEEAQQEGAPIPSAFSDLGLRAFEGFRTNERVYAFGTPE